MPLWRHCRASGLSFSLTKNATAATTESLARRVCARLVGITVKAAARCISLGTGLGVGARRNAQQMRKRLVAFRGRLHRFKLLRRSRVRTDRLLRTGRGGDAEREREWERPPAWPGPFCPS